MNQKERNIFRKGERRLRRVGQVDLVGESKPGRIWASD